MNCILTLQRERKNGEKEYFEKRKNTFMYIYIYTNSSTVWYLYIYMWYLYDVSSKNRKWAENRISRYVKVDQKTKCIGKTKTFYYPYLCECSFPLHVKYFNTIKINGDKISKLAKIFNFWKCILHITLYRIKSKSHENLSLN